jgi:hypothetical protein
VKSLKARLEVARERVAEKKETAPVQNANPSSQKNNHKRNRHTGGGNSKVADIDFEQAKMLKRNFHGDEYDDFGQVKQKKNKMNHNKNSSQHQNNNSSTFGTDTASQSKQLISNF